MEIIIDSFKNSILITGFVFTMMLIVEYLNVLTKGMWFEKLRKGISQYFIGAFLGAIPGCLGSFAAVALYAHGRISIGALISCMIATSGDEAFLMMAMFPLKAVILFAVLFVIGVAAGFLVDIIFKKYSKNIEKETCCIGLEVHEHEREVNFTKAEIIRDFKNLSMRRGVILIGLILYAIGVLSGYIGDTDDPSWIKITIVISSLIAAVIISIVPEHFLEEHLWKHIVKNHIPSIYLWTFGTLLISGYLLQMFDIANYIKTNQITVMFLSAVIGIIPISGQNIIFVTLYAKGMIPFAILLCNSIVQDGHGMIPLLSISKKDFLFAKIINIIFGVTIGFLLIKLL